jgi:hypothetical protein
MDFFCFADKKAQGGGPGVLLFCKTCSLLLKYFQKNIYICHCTCVNVHIASPLPDPMNALTNLPGVPGVPGGIGMGPRPPGAPMGGMGQMQMSQHAMAGVAGNPQSSEYL